MDKIVLAVESDKMIGLVRTCSDDLGYVPTHDSSDVRQIGVLSGDEEKDGVLRVIQSGARNDSQATVHYEVRSYRIKYVTAEHRNLSSFITCQAVTSPIL